MPLYEYFCGGCRTTFEALIPLSASQQRTHACPSCGDDARRILSAVNFTAERREAALPQNHTRGGKSDVTSLKLPPAARLCWMDDQSAARLAAYKVGRGAEYDDTVASRKELASKRGDGENGKPAQPVHSHSPLADSVVLANRRKAAQKEKVAASATIKKAGDGKTE